MQDECIRGPVGSADDELDDGDDDDAVDGNSRASGIACRRRTGLQKIREDRIRIRQKKTRKKMEEREKERREKERKEKEKEKASGAKTY